LGQTRRRPKERAIYSRAAKIKSLVRIFGAHESPLRPILTKLRSSWPRRGPDFLITGEYWYSGLTGEGLWGENGQTNGNGQPLFLPDAFFNR
jgi:hypothetical protein